VKPRCVWSLPGLVLVAGRLRLGMALGLFLCLPLVWLSARGLGAANIRATTRYVSASDALCGGHAPCYHNVQDAVDAAGLSDAVLVQGGTYIDSDTASVGYVVMLTKTISLHGGYNGGFAEPPDPAANPTILDAQGLGRVISVSGNTTPTIAGFVITGGNAHGRGGGLGNDAGGGVSCGDAHPIIAGNIITGNTASSNSGVDGGGISLAHCHRAVVTDNIIANNTASSGGFGRGGGVSADYSNGVVISGNQVMANAASTASTGYGGGIYLYTSDVTVTGNTIVGNWGSTVASGEGGGLWTEYGYVSIGHNHVQTNTAGVENRDTGGGGLFAVYGDGVALAGNTFTGNVADSGGAIGIVQGTSFTLTNNILAGSRAQHEGDALAIAGYSGYPSIGRLLHNTIADNRGDSSEAVHVTALVSLSLTNNIIAGHMLGITNAQPASATVTADHTLFYANAAD
jgi:hypothetical protein